MKTWTEKDFEQLGWHDNHVHGFVIVEGENGMGELIVDLDYILEWLKPTPERFEFLIAPATLTFKSVFDLKVNVDYSEPRAAIGPFSISGIERDVREYPTGYSTYRWLIEVNWPRGEISFIASGFIQVLRSEPIRVTNQYLLPAQRAPL